MISDTDRAYAAGFLDGEGSIGIFASLHVVKGKEYRQAIMRVEASNTYLPVLEWLRARWGGSLVQHHGRRSPKWKPAFVWRIQARQAEAFLTQVRPYLVVKAERADNALAFQRTKHRTGKRYRLSDADWATTQSFLNRSRELNRKGPSPALGEGVGS